MAAWIIWPEFYKRSRKYQKYKTYSEIRMFFSWAFGANLIFVSPYPTLFYRYGSVGRFFLTSQIGYPLNLIVYSKTCLKRPLKKIQKNCLFFSRQIIAYGRSKVLQNARHLSPICLNDLCCVYLWVAILGRFNCIYSPTIGNIIEYTNNLLR